MTFLIDLGTIFLYQCLLVFCQLLLVFNFFFKCFFPGILKEILGVLVFKRKDSLALPKILGIGHVFDSIYVPWGVGSQIFHFNVLFKTFSVSNFTVVDHSVWHINISEIVTFGSLSSERSQLDIIGCSKCSFRADIKY